MSKSDKKLQQLKLQHEISEILREDNGVSCHFDYHVNLLSDNQTIKLNLLTYNQKHNEYMLLHTSLGSSSLDCLKQMLSYIKSSHDEEQQYTFTVTWSRKGESEKHLSYFVASKKEEVESKFLHEKDPRDYEYQIAQNPIS